MTRYTRTLLIPLAGLLGCQGSLPPQPFEPTADGGETELCPSGMERRCITDIDNGTVCTCVNKPIDPCEKYPNKAFCSEMPTPDGSSDWTCTWTEFKYSCTRKDNGKTPTGGGSWTCVPNNEGGWTCTKNELPVPDGSGGWKCFVDNEAGALICEKENPGGDLTWKCVTDQQTGKTVCTTTGGLPSGGGNWKCHKSGDTWTCYGDIPPGGTPPGGAGWTCVKMKTELGKEIYKCQKKGDDLPGGKGDWICTKGTELNGTKCVQGTPPPPPKLGAACKIGDKAWCDGHTFCGWGQVSCDPKTGTWETEINQTTGKPQLKCYEVKDLRPNTVCACYHTFYNEACCERPDCIIPPGTQGQVCPKSPGKLCDYCNPLQVGSCVEPGAKCVYTSSNETFCGRECSVSKPCPAGYTCASYKLKGVTYKQCVPVDGSCYY
jgi:hypothetical protein